MPRGGGGQGGERGAMFDIHRGGARSGRLYSEVQYITGNDDMGAPGTDRHGGKNYLPVTSLANSKY